MIEVLITPLVVSVIGTTFTILLSQHLKGTKENRTKIAELYHELLNLKVYYELLAGYELRQEELPPKQVQFVEIERYRSLDALRQTRTRLTYKIIEALTLEGMGYRWRMQQLAEIIDALGYVVNSDYKKACQEVDRKNLEYYAARAINSGIIDP